MRQSRTHTCGELRLTDAGKTVTIAGWMENLREVGANFAFLVLRDYYGTTQVVIQNEEMMARVKGVNKESTLQVTGIVRERESKNPKQPTGDIEIEPTDIQVLGKCRYNSLPFEINKSKEADENTRLKYRFLDLRNPAVKKNIVLRCNVVARLRQLMTQQGFLEITTPILTSSSPEGARDYLVPARNHPGKFYALPQAPQQFKQLLMTAGFDKYFQIAPCFRDEDARADRTPGEFYQLDMEMAWCTIPCTGPMPWKPVCCKKYARNIPNILKADLGIKRPLPLWCRRGRFLLLRGRRGCGTIPAGAAGRTTTVLPAGESVPTGAAAKAALAAGTAHAAEAVGGAVDQAVQSYVAAAATVGGGNYFPIRGQGQATLPCRGNKSIVAGMAGAEHVRTVDQAHVLMAGLGQMPEGQGDACGGFGPEGIYPRGLTVHADYHEGQTDGLQGFDKGPGVGRGHQKDPVHPLGFDDMGQGTGPGAVMLGDHAVLAAHDGLHDAVDDAHGRKPRRVVVIVVCVEHIFLGLAHINDTEGMGPALSKAPGPVVGHIAQFLHHLLDVTAGLLF